MNTLLQNNPHEHIFPVRGKWKYLEQYKKTHPLFYIVALLSGVVCLSLFFFLIVSLTQLAATHFQLPEGRQRYGLLALIYAFLQTLCCFILFVRFLCRTPVREQLQYYKSSGATLLPEAKRQALRLHVVDMFYAGFWIETLEYYPLASHKGKHRYYALYTENSHEYRTVLDDDWSILDQEDYTAVTEQLLTTGYHSASFAVTLSLYNQERAHSKRLAALTGLSQSYILSCLEPGPDGRPPRLIWGYEYWRTIVVARNAFMAGYITAERAWQDILQAASFAFELFDSFEDFHNNTRLGNAFWSDSYEAANEKSVCYQFFKEKCDWPIVSLPWPAPQGIRLPAAMAGGYAHKIELARKMMHQRDSLN
ncbi:DUF1266 domain-containing protein [Chitinophaga nivalis]|uniref:DUF1266 domain-containing protein n=1 Tax=Chitinophaga nivalis TaxID=2991709 RepID=A0ABT3IN12_9BACT|nr:DUF1266 domain-containing protein [Chitinophaga nivalis]MCW3465199.1 DUF1266 domain-containing protein [Chitinophaga nivalis]MCW3485109.1 DUF1266 domain-containing protein [Chitinophaga nivalis]